MTLHAQPAVAPMEDVPTAHGATTRTGMRRREVLLGAAVSTALMGCNSKSSAKVELDFWAMGREAEVVGALLPAFYARYPDIAVRVQQIPWSSAHEKLLTAYVGNSLPDLFQLGNTWVAEMAQLDMLEPLEPYLAHATSTQAEDYFPAILQTNRAGRITKGSADTQPALLGLPWYVDTRLLFYRTDLLKDAGFSQPAQTWEQWRQMLEALRHSRQGKGQAIFLPVNEFEPLLALGLQQEEALLKDNMSRGNFSNPGFRDALSLYRDIFAKGWAELQGKEQISNLWTEFGRGQFAYFISGPWSIGELKRRLAPEQQDQWACATLPGPKAPGVSVAGGSSLSICKSSRHKPEAWALLEYLNEPAVQAQFFELTGNLPSRMATWKSAGIANDPKIAAFAEQLQRTKAAPAVLEWERIVVDMQRGAENMVRQGSDVVTTARLIDAKVDAILAKRRELLAGNAPQQRWASAAQARLSA